MSRFAFLTCFFLTAFGASATVPYCFQVLTRHETVSNIGVFETIRRNGLNHEKFFFRVQKSIFVSAEKESYTSYIVHLHSSNREEDFSQNLLGTLHLIESAHGLPKFIYSTSIKAMQPGSGVGTLLYLLGARIAEEFYQRPLGTISKEEGLSGALTLKHSPMARHAWERMHSFGWADFKTLEVNETFYEFFIFNSRKVKTLTNEIWKLFQKNHTYVKELG